MPLLALTDFLVRRDLVLASFDGLSLFLFLLKRSAEPADWPLAVPLGLEEAEGGLEEVVVGVVEGLCEGLLGKG